MSDQDMSRDRVIRAEALHAATRLAAAAITVNAEAEIADIAHNYAHWIHSGVWFDGKCPYGVKCRFNKTDGA